MERIPYEIFGHPIKDRSKQAEKDRKRRWCPFVNKKCSKQSRLEYPFGVCSVRYENELIAICPKRFRQQDLVFKDIAKAAFGSLHNLLLFDEIKLGDIGSCDFVVVKHKPLKKDIEDFMIVEFQTGQTTGTGNLVQAFRDFRNGKELSGKHYGFSMNFFDIWKREFTQILFKGMVMEHWGKQIFWVVQTPVFQYLVKKYHLKGFHKALRSSTIFVTYDLKLAGKRSRLCLEGYHSITIDNLFKSLKHNQPIPDIQDFLAKISKRIGRKKTLELHLAEK